MSLTPQTLRCYPKAQLTQGADRDGGGPSPKVSYRLDSQCDGTAKNSDEKEVTVGQCKATTEAREQGKSDQLGLGHIHPVCEFECGKARPDPPLSRTTGRDLSPRTLACRRRDQLTKALDYGAVLVAITVAHFICPRCRSVPSRPGSSHRASQPKPTNCLPAAIGCMRSSMTAFGLPAQLFTGALWRAARPGHPKWGA